MGNFADREALERGLGVLFENRIVYSVHLTEDLFRQILRATYKLPLLFLWNTMPSIFIACIGS
jgi:hypothetical protein